MNKSGSRQVITGDMEIDPKKSLNQYFPDKDEYIPKSNPMKNAFCKKIKELQVAGEKVMTLLDYPLSSSDIIQIIATRFKYNTWGDIPYGMFDEITRWIERHGYLAVKIMAPDLHCLYTSIAAGLTVYRNNPKTAEYLVRHDIPSKCTTKDVFNFVERYANEFNDCKNNRGNV